MNNNTRAKCAELIKTFESGDKFFYKSENGNYLDIEFTGKVSEKFSCGAEFRVLKENKAGFNVGELVWLDVSKGSFEPMVNKNIIAKCAELIKKFKSGNKYSYTAENGKLLNIEFTGNVSKVTSCVAEFRVLTENKAGFNVGEIFWLDISKGSFEPLANASRVNGNAANRRRKSRKTRKATRRNRK
jgi:hypothetical protein